MKTKLTLIAFFLVVVAIALLASGCPSVESRGAWDEFNAYVELAEADGVVDAAEAAEITRLFKEASGKSIEDVAGLDWKQRLLDGGIAILVAILTGNYVRNRNVWGTTRKSSRP